MATDHDHQDRNSGGCDHGCDHGHESFLLPRGWLVGLSGFFTLVGLLLEWTHVGPAWWHQLAFALGTLLGGLLVFPAAWRAVRGLRLDMNVLMSVAVLGAWVIGQGEEAASVVFLFALSEWLESWSAGRARRAIGSLLKLAPETALVCQPGGGVNERPVSELLVGDEVMIRSGARVPADGEVTDGASSINQAPITGESVPVDKRPGETVYAGTVNGEGSLRVRVTKLARDSTLSRIIKMVEDAEEQKAPTQRFVDRFAQIYTPLVFLVALLVAVVPPLFWQQSWETWTYRSLVLLVIACPCALVIATPVSIVAGLTALAQRGVLVKGGAYLEAVGKLQALALDKTGTITRGQPQVMQVMPLPGHTEEEILQYAAAVDSHSEHPLAKAVVAAAQQRQITVTPASDYRSRTGRGAEAVIDGHPFFVGNHRLTHEMGVCSPELESQLSEIESQGMSLTIVGHRPHGECRGEVLGIIAIGDALRGDAPAALKRLKAIGLQRIVMLSGDNQRTVDAIARQAGIDQAVGDLLPEQKVEQIQTLIREYQYVGMIGDGVNDAPALATASVGIAMGAMGSDTAIETADLALMQDDLTRVAEAIEFGRRTVRIIQFNVAFALTLKAVFLLLAVTGHASLWMAILADTGATLLVILNSLRLLRPQRSTH